MSKFKAPRHAVSKLVSQPTPGTSRSTRLSKSFSDLGDVQPPGPLQSVKRRALRGRRSAGSTEFKKGEDLHVLELDEDTETPRGHIEAFLKNADTGSQQARSTRQTPGRQNARSFTRTPSKLIKTRSGSNNTQAERRELSLPSPGSAFTPRVNIERLLEGSGSEYSPLKRSFVAMGTRSDSKVPSSRRSRNWGQRVSASPMFNSTIEDATEDNRVSLGGSFRSLRQRRAFQIPEPPGPATVVKSLSQQTPSTDRLLNSRLSKSDSKIRRVSKTWGQRVSISPMNHPDVGEIGHASPGNEFKHPGHRRSFHIPEPPETEEPELGPGDEKHGYTVSKSSGQEQNEPQSDEEILAARLLKRDMEDVALDSSAHVSKLKTSLDNEMKDRMKIYDLSDGSSDSDFTPELFMNAKSQVASAKMNKTWSLDSTTPTSSRKLLSRKRPSGSSQHRGSQSAPKASHFSSGTLDSASASKRRRLDIGDGETTPDLPTDEIMSGGKSCPAGVTPVPSAPPSSTPLKREQRSRVKAVGEDTPTTVYSRQNQKDSEAIAALSNETLSGLSPIRAVEEDGIANPVSIDVLEDMNEESELSPLTCSLVAMGTRSDSKVASSQSSRNLGQGVSASPVGVEDENRVSPVGSPGSPQERRSSEIPEPPGPDTTVDKSHLSPDIADKAEQKEAGDTEHEGSDFQNSDVVAVSNEGLENIHGSENDSSGGSSSMATPFIDITKKPPFLSARKLNLLTPFRESKGKPARGTKKAATSKRSAKSQIGSRDCDFVTRKMVKFYAERFSTMKMDKEVVDMLIEASNDFWIQNLKAAEGYSMHAGRSTITEADVVLLMKVQRMCNSTAELHDLIRDYLPMELRCDLIPTAKACVSPKSKSTK